MSGSGTSCSSRPRKTRAAPRFVLWVLSLVFTFPAAVVWGQPNGEWAFLGPEGGEILWLGATTEATPRLLARGLSRLYRSSNNGRAWTVIEGADAVIGGRTPGMNSVAISLLDTNTLFAISGNERVYRSRDFGASWQLVFDRLQAFPDVQLGELLTIAVSREQGETLHVFGKVHNFGDRSSYELVSTDAGSTWTTRFLDFCRNAQSLEVLAFTEDLLEPRRQYLVIDGRASSCPSDPGASNGLQIREPDGAVVASDNAFASGSRVADVQRIGNQTFYLLGGRMHRSGVGEILSGVEVNAFRVLSPSVIHAATTTAYFVSENGGATWQARATGEARLGALHRGNALLDTVDGGVVYAAGAGLARTEDGAASWQFASSGITEYRLRSLEVSEDGSRLWAGVFAAADSRRNPSPGLFLSEDRGSTWIRSQLGELAWTVRDIEIDPNSPSAAVRVYAVGTGCGPFFCGSAYANGGIYASDDGGRSFRVSDAGVPTPGQSWRVGEIRDFELDPHSFGGGLFRNALIAGQNWSYSPGRSTDAGASWQPTQGLSRYQNFFFLEQTAFDRLLPNRVYAATRTDYVFGTGVTPGPPGATFAGAFRSDDGGANWHRASRGLPELSEFPGSGAVQSLSSITTDVAGAERVWATMQDLVPAPSHLYRTDTGGADWYPCARTPTERLTNVVQDLARPSRLLIGDGGVSLGGTSLRGSVWVSDNRCLTWQQLGNTLPAGVNRVAIRHGRAFAATDIGLYAIDLPETHDGVIFLSNFEQH